MYMTEKRYCFVPETYKNISVYNANTIYNTILLNDIYPTTSFKYCIDDYDKIKLFYINGQEDKDATDNEEYFKYKTIAAIKAIFNVSELYDYKLFLDENARVEFTLFYDKDGNNILLKDLITKNKFNTILAHRYTYNFYKRYDI